MTQVKSFPLGVGEMRGEWLSFDVTACVMESRARVWQTVCEMKIKKETDVRVVVLTYLHSASLFISIPEDHWRAGVYPQK